MHQDKSATGKKCIMERMKHGKSAIWIECKLHCNVKTVQHRKVQHKSSATWTESHVKKVTGREKNLFTNVRQWTVCYLFMHYNCVLFNISPIHKLCFLMFHMQLFCNCIIIIIIVVVVVISIIIAILVIVIINKIPTYFHKTIYFK